ncbi:alpha-L-rhamnosidase [Tamlana crocina]|uniref:alpha-L-rhamnosidase n=1 Tax=Tamlana crocina TaxID=393006 RepID=A0ABX1DDS5_9FLAO|nr:alpha-L-rhamnosidase [Tamlana crocina]NJX14446.1 family 78 glycoside hydrolase catalytic domain [Tamlana crocina]
MIKTNDYGLKFSLILMKFIPPILILLFFTNCAQNNIHKVHHSVNINQLYTSYLNFDWQIEGLKKNKQSAYQIIVYAQNPNTKNTANVIWDSGKTESKQQASIPYSGPRLKGGSTYLSEVLIWDESNTVSKSEPQPFIAPLKYPEDWKANWITYDYVPEAALPIFRKSFEINPSTPIDFARLHIAAPGFYEAYINGKKIGKNVLDPAQTNYDDYVFYSTYDIPVEQFTPSNVMGVMLGNGWYNQNLVWSKAMAYGQPVFIAQLEVHYTNGQKEIIETNSSWKWHEGPITFTNIYAGEHYDARAEVENWLSPNLDATGWINAKPSKNHPTKIIKQFAQPIKVMDSIVPKKIKSSENGSYIFDFGQNFTGWVKLQVTANKGQEITMRFSEELDKKGQMDFRSTGVKATKNIQTEKYTAKGTEMETWEPRFTYHGFRYVEVSGLNKQPSKDLLTGMVVYSSMNETGQFHSSEPNINKLHELTNWTLKSNLQGIPTDCPHREKCGWTGDAHALAKTLIYNFDAQKFLTKYIFDMRSSGRKAQRELYFGRNFHDRSIITKPKGITTMIAPGRRTSGVASPDWGTAIVQLPWYLYLHYADKAALKAFYPDMKTWVEYVHAKNENGIIPHGLGDWCPPGGNVNIDCPVPISSSAFHILDVSIMKKTAAALGLIDDEKHYSEMEKNLILSFNQTFLNKESVTYGSQTANSLALDIGIVPEQYQTGVAKAIVDESHNKFNGFLNTGIFGISRIFKVLCENGFEDEAYRLLSKKGNHSFETMWQHYDATTLWEILPTSTDDELYDVLMLRSHNHPMQGGFDAWFYSGIAGINPSEEQPGFEKIILKPYLTKQLQYAEASYNTKYGTIESKWKNENDTFIWEIQIPKNSSAEVFLPTYGKNVSLLINGESVNLNVSKSMFSSIGTFEDGHYIIEMTQKKN